MDGAHAHTNHYFSLFERQPSDTVKEDTEENTEDDIIPELIRFFTLEIVEFNTETAEENIIPELIKIPWSNQGVIVRGYMYPRPKTSWGLQITFRIRIGSNF
jgi:hypothetical protein